MCPAIDSICGHCGYFLSSIRPHPTTLAQRRGLVAFEPQVDALTEKEWQQVEKKADGRGDAFCPICMEVLCRFNPFIQSLHCDCDS